jgi:hypothetical protein
MFPEYSTTTTVALDNWKIIIEYCNTIDWIQLSYTCKDINNIKYEQLLMKNKKRTLKCGHVQDIALSKGTLFNVNFSSNQEIEDHDFSSLQGTIHTLDMSICLNITDEAFVYLKGIHALDISYCIRITDKAFSYLPETTLIVS